jgi:hypothetical protein
MKLSDILMILAVLVGPIIAVQLTRYLDDKKEKRERKLQVFKTLMATRAYITSWDHVGALNRIDLEFDRNITKEKDVVIAWKAYLDVLTSYDKMPHDQWEAKRTDLFVDLLHKMAQVFDYDFDPTHIKNSSYAPKGHREIEQMQNKILSGFAEMLDYKRFLPVTVLCCNQAPTKQVENVNAVQ